MNNLAILALCLIPGEPPLVLEPGSRVVFVGNTFADQLRLYGYLETTLTARLPDHRLSFRNLGWSGDTLRVQPRPLNFGSLDEHLRQQRADVVVACFGMNESFEGERGLANFAADWTQLIKQMQAQSYNGRGPPQLVMISPIAHEELGGPLPAAKDHNRDLALYTQAMARIAAEDEIPFVDLYAATTELMLESQSQKLTHNGIHLNQYGYWATAQLIASALAPPHTPWRVVLDAKLGSLSKSSGTNVHSVQVHGDGLSFVVRDIRLPPPPAPTESTSHRSLSERQPLLVVKNLKAGQYELRIDGTTVARADHTAWALGVIPRRAPNHQQVEQLRKTIVAKNSLFFYRWRPANSEYVFGRRTKPFGSVSFPPEMQQLSRMIGEHDRQIVAANARPKQQKWEIVSVPRR